MASISPMAWIHGPIEGPQRRFQFSVANVNCVLQRLHPEDREAVSKTLAKALSSEGTYETEYRVVLPDGRMRWIASRGGVEFDANGKPVLMRGAALDITTRKQAHAALARSEQRYRSLFRDIPVGLWQIEAQPLTAMLTELRGQGVECPR